MRAGRAACCWLVSLAGLAARPPTGATDGERSAYAIDVASRCRLLLSVPASAPCSHVPSSCYCRRLLPSHACCAALLAAAQ
ncbi:hypothetical protein PF008_g11587 [Phytophthora fragariae]|uniref:Secreted protein n=1 Tax=Phytophthora fragariae TaxID=53985 RepID=A0A6G0RRX3_9STRA|nr:hypothetical protein PF008_g11587 [Phytophthora fragariae]